MWVSYIVDINASDGDIHILELIKLLRASFKEFAKFVVVYRLLVSQIEWTLARLTAPGPG